MIGPIIKESKVMLTTIDEFWDENSAFDINFHPWDEHEAREFKQLLIKD
jgi:hypothetical protein